MGLRWSPRAEPCASRSEGPEGPGTEVNWVPVAPKSRALTEPQ